MANPGKYQAGGTLSSELMEEATWLYGGPENTG